MAYETLIVDIENHVCLIKLNRPDALNALNIQLLGELSKVIKSANSNDKVRVMVITGSDKAFAAGDVRRGQSLVVWAINEGRAVARECDRFLMGTTKLP
mgnify:CR=1 FL=1